MYTLLITVPLYIYINNKQYHSNNDGIVNTYKPTYKKYYNKLNEDKNKYVYSTNSTLGSKVLNNMINNTNYRIVNEPYGSSGLAWTNYNISKYPDNTVVNKIPTINNTIYKLDVTKPIHKNKLIKKASYYNNNGNLYSSLSYYDDSPMVSDNSINNINPYEKSYILNNSVSYC